jgi:drug/metabolite transporter (DMT)-like permease
MRVQWVPEFIFALGWACLVLSMGATLLFFLLLRRGAAAKTSSLLYLVPPCTAIIAYFLFGETLGPTALGGMALAMIGVILANRS